MAKSKPLNLYYRLEALAWHGLIGGLGALKLEQASALGAGALKLIGPLSSAHTTMLRNLRLAFPNETEAWRAEVAKASWDSIGRMTGEFPHMAEFVNRLERGEVTFGGQDIIHSAIKTGAVYIGGHFSNWEVMSLCLAQIDRECFFTYRPANNPIIDQYIVDNRRTFGLELQAAKGKTGGMGLLRALGKGKTVALMNDQKYNNGVASPLFGHPCMTADGPARMALRFKVPLVPLSVRRVEGVRFHVQAYEPIALDYDTPGDEAVQAGVDAVNRFIEARILEAPEQWFWVRRRWPKEAWRKAGVM